MLKSFDGSVPLPKDFMTFVQVYIFFLLITERDGTFYNKYLYNFIFFICVVLRGGNI